MQTLLPYLFIILPAALFAALLRRRFETVLPLTLSGTILILYLFAILGALRAGFYAVVSLSALSLVLLVALCIRKSVSLLREWVLTPGLAAFLLFSLLSVLFSTGRLLSEWDEFSHWGLAAKNVYLMDALWRGDSSTVIFKTYPPAATLLQYFFLQFSPGFYERVLYRGIQCLMFACMCPVFAFVNWRDWKKLLTYFGILFALPLLFYKNAYALTYVDATMGLLMGYLLLLFFLPDGEQCPVFRSVAFALTGSVLVLIKPAGIGLFALVSIIIGLYLLLCERPRLTLRPVDEAGTRSVFMLLLPVAAALVFLGSWALYRAGANIQDTFFSKPSTFTWERLVNLLTGNGEAYDLVVIRRFIQCQLQRYHMAANQNISILTWLLTFPALAALIRSRSEGPLKKYATSIPLWLFAGYILYSLSLIYAYACCFSSEEALGMLSCDRYMFTYLLACIMLLTGLLITRPRTGRFFLYLLMCAVLVIGGKDLDSSAFSNVSRNIREDFQDTETFPGRMDPAADRVYYISNYYDTIDFYIARYNMTPIPMLDTPPPTDGYPAPEAGALEEALLLGGYTYVYVYSVSEDYAEPFAALFDDPVTNRTLYAVNVENGRARLSVAARFDTDQ